MSRQPEFIKIGRTLHVDAVHGKAVGRPDRPAKPYQSVLTALIDAQQLVPTATNPVEIVLAGHVHDIGQNSAVIPLNVNMRWESGAVLKSTARQSTEGSCVNPVGNNILYNPVIDGGSWLNDGIDRVPLGCNVADPALQAVPQNVLVFGGQILGEGDALFVDSRFSATPASIRCIGTQFFSKFDTVNMWASGAASLIELIGCYGVVTGPSSNGGGTLARCLTSQANGLVRAIGGYWKVSGATTNNRTVSGNTGMIELDGGIVLVASGAGARTIHGYTTIGTATFDPTLIDAGATITWKDSAAGKRTFYGDVSAGLPAWPVRMMNWAGITSWLDIPTPPGQPSGIGTGGPGVNAIVGIAGAAGHWCTGAIAGDIIYRNGGGMLFSNTGAAKVMEIRNDGFAMFGSAPIGKQAVTGSRAGNAALASLLAKLAAYGIITDNTTA